MEAILYGLQVILAVVVIVLVLLHSGKDSGLSGAFGVGTGAGALTALRPTRMNASTTKAIATITMTPVSGSNPM